MGPWAEPLEEVSSGGCTCLVFVIWYLKGALSGRCVVCFREVAALLSLHQGVSLAVPCPRCHMNLLTRGSFITSSWTGLH